MINRYHNESIRLVLTIVILFRDYELLNSQSIGLFMEFKKKPVPLNQLLLSVDILVSFLWQTTFNVVHSARRSIVSAREIFLFSSTAFRLFSSV